MKRSGALWLLAGCLFGLGGHGWAASVKVDVKDAAGKPLADAAVFLESPEARRAVKPVSGLEMAQEQKRFLPTVLMVPVGSEVQFPNRDTVRHHVYSFSPAKSFELKLYAGTPANPVLFDRSGVVVLGCNIHDQMVGWVLVMDTPYYGRTSATGSVQLDNVPAGTYKLRTWHSRMAVGAPALEQELRVSSTGSVTATVQMVGLAP